MSGRTREVRRSPSRLDFAIAAGMLVAIEAEIWISGIDGPRWVTSLCGAVSAIALAWRRVAPATVVWITAAAVVLPILAGKPKEEGTLSALPIVFAMFALGQATLPNRGSRARAYGTLAGAMILVWAANVNQRGAGGGDFVYLAVLFLVPYLLGRVVGASRRDSQRNARRAAQAIRDREASRARAVADERVRIARELHDVISHSVSLMGIQAGAARKVLPRGLDEVEDVLRSIEAAGRDTLDEMRRLLGIMREGGQDPTGREPQPGVATLDELAAQARAAGVEVEIDVDADLVALPPGLDLVVYRIVQEALTNVRRHAPGSVANVRLARRRNELQIEISNIVPAGVGDPDTPGAGHGIIGMRERTALYDGTFSAGLVGGERFVVTSVLPIDPARGAWLDVVER